MTPTLHLLLLAVLAGGSADPAPTSPASSPSASSVPTAVTTTEPAASPWTRSVWAPATPQDDAIQAARRLLDYGIAIIGSRVVTANEMGEILNAPKYRQRQAEGEEDQVLIVDALRELTMTRLEIDAGIARGFPADLVNDRVDALIAQNQKAAGGPHRFAKALEADGMTPVTYRKYLKDSTYRFAWQRWAKGEDAGPKGRRSVDRYIRPGMLAVTYDLSIESPLEAQKDLVGKSPQRFVLRRLHLAPQVGQSFSSQGDKLLRTARDIYDDIQSGDSDFQGALVSYDLDQGRKKPLQPASLATLVSVMPALHGAGETLTAFLRTAAVGDVSEPMVAYNTSGQGFAVFLYELAEIQPEQAAQSFATLEMQLKLKRHLTDQVDERRLLQKQLILLEAGHVFPEAIKQDVAASLLRNN
tara:strand:- start:20678 stop:21919 length:1242 start_codon:yes stop_codon:yes gene_type:complete